MTSGTTEETPDLVSLHRKLTTDGYREGISHSKPQFAQSGFDEGYPLGARIGLALGRILGKLRGLTVLFPGDAELSRTLQLAEEEMGKETVFSELFWDGDGVWRWSVPREDEATLDEVVDAFPIFQKWRVRMRELVVARNLGLNEEEDKEDTRGCIKEQVKEDVKNIDLALEE
jgi:hypothetical protein